jgi:hypothetical protein
VVYALPLDAVQGDMRIDVTDEAVLITELSEEDRHGLELTLRRTGGRSLVIPRKPTVHPPLTEAEELEALISALRTSAQDTLAALRRRGFRIARYPS